MSEEVSPLIINPSSNDISIVGHYSNGVNTIITDTTTMTKCNNNSSSNNNNNKATASYHGTIVNIMKTCMGTGCLAFAYACQQGGIVLYIIGVILIGIWNYIVMFLLIDCKKILHDSITTKQQQNDVRTKNCVSTTTIVRNYYESINDSRGEIINVEQERYVHQEVSSISTQLQPPPQGLSTMGIIAWYTYGTFGLQVLDCIIVLLFLGIITAYVAAVITFLSFTPITTTSRLYDAIITGCIMGTMAIVPDIGYLSRASGIGLIVLFTAFLIICIYGIIDDHSLSTSSSNVIKSTDMIEVDTANMFNTNDSILKLWPSSTRGISHYYGIAVFGYGAVPLTYNFQESMHDPSRIVPATGTAITLVAISNIVLGVGLYILYPNLTSDVLHELPSSGIIPNITRLAMVGTIVATAPLLIVPCSELLEGRWIITTSNALQEKSTILGRIIVRYGLVSVCVIVAVLLPNFVEVLALVGCFCVAMVSFCVPPALHLRLLYLTHNNNGTKSNTIHEVCPITTNIILDSMLLFCGVIATIVSTACTFMK